MKLKDISISNLRRRKGKVFFLILGLSMGITTVVALISITRIRADDGYGNHNPENTAFSTRSIFLKDGRIKS